MEKCFIFWREKQSAISETYENNTRMRVTHRFEMGVYPRMHQTSNNRYTLNGYGSLRVAPIACGLEAPKRHGKKDGFLSICILPSVITNNKDLLKTRLIFNVYAQISCKNDWNNFLLLNTNAPLSSASERKPIVLFCTDLALAESRLCRYPDNSPSRTMPLLSF